MKKMWETDSNMLGFNIKAQNYSLYADENDKIYKIDKICKIYRI